MKNKRVTVVATVLGHPVISIGNNPFTRYIECPIHLRESGIVVVLSLRKSVVAFLPGANITIACSESALRETENDFRPLPGDVIAVSIS